MFSVSDLTQWCFDQMCELTFWQRRKQYANAITVEEIKREQRVRVSTIPMYLFLFRDGEFLHYLLLADS